MNPTSSQFGAKDLETQRLVLESLQAAIPKNVNSLTCEETIAIYSPVLQKTQEWLKNFSFSNFSVVPREEPIANFRSLMNRVQTLARDGNGQKPRSNNFNPLLNDEIRDEIFAWTNQAMGIVEAKWIKEEGERNIDEFRKSFK